MTKKLAIVERLPGHTEVMGGFAALARELGWDVHLLFNRKDAFHFVDYLATRLEIANDQVHDWSYINDHDAEFDAILLNTSYVWLEYGFRLQQWAASRRLLVVHHLPEDVELNPHGVSLYLTPAVDREKWIFPLYGKPGLRRENPHPSTRSGLAFSQNQGEVGHPNHADLPALVTIGALDLKDIAGVSAYMKAGGSVVHFDRHKCRFFPSDGNYSQQVGLGGAEFMRSLAAFTPPVFLWFPILPESVYMVFRFTGALIMGVDLNCVMVMPERLRRLYGFPEEAVIAYESSAMERLEALREPSAKQLERRNRLAEWAEERWERNLEIFRGLLTHA